MKGKVDTVIHISNCEIHVESDAELLPDGSLKITYHEPIIIPQGAFRIATLRDWR